MTLFSLLRCSRSVTYLCGYFANCSLIREVCLVADQQQLYVGVLNVAVNLGHPRLDTSE